MDRTQLKQANDLVNRFQKTKERGEFRNKLGRVWWPIMNRFITYGVPALAVTAILSGGATLPSLAAGVATWAIGRPITKGFSVNVQNISLQNAALFGRSIKNEPKEIRLAAMERYLQKAGAWVFNKDYLKHHPDSLAQLANGKPVAKIPNFIALLEHNMNYLINKAERNGKNVSFAERLGIWRKTWAEYKGQTQQGAQTPVPKSTLLQNLKVAQATADAQKKVFTKQTPVCIQKPMTPRKKLLRNKILPRSRNDYS